MDMKKKDIIGTCMLCEQKGLHVFTGVEDSETQQCISCGYVTSDRYKLNDGESTEDNKLYGELTPQMREWSVTVKNRIWIPTMITLPIGMIYPMNSDDDEMVWAFAEMVDISKEERENYPVEGQSDKFYERRYDDSEPDIFENFYDHISY